MIDLIQNRELIHTFENFDEVAKYFSTTNRSTLRTRLKKGTRFGDGYTLVEW